MAHTPTSADVERALQRYRDVTGDLHARVDRSGKTGSFYRLEGIYRGEWYGAAAASAVINGYCDGYRDGQADMAEEAVNLG